ncbi:MAG: CHASE3 domain-containing protein [Caulobacteraceae bacterium]|nr:CHASE3 domain-containing protein [Caulobacteraceae bacterium]
MTRSDANHPKPWRELIAPVGLLAFLGLLMAFLAVVHFYTVRQSRARVHHTHEVIENAQGLFSLVQDVESGLRGYLASGDPRLLDAYDASLPKIPAAVAKLTALTADNPKQAALVARLNAMIKVRVQVAEQRVALARQGHLDQARTVTFLRGRAAMMSVRGSMAELINTENDLLADRSARADLADLLSFAVTLALSVLSIAGLTVLMVSMVRANRRLGYEIEERLAAEAAREEGHALYRAIFDNTADLLYVIDVGADGTMVLGEVNPAYERAVGAAAAELRGLDLVHMAPDGQREDMLAHVQAVSRGDRPVFTRTRVSLPQGERVWESVMAPLRGPSGRVERIVGSSRDVTEREQAQEQLRRAQRMEAIGHLTGGVAHDFNNLLQVMRGNLELISAQVGDGPAAPRIRNALHAAERAAQLTRHLLAFARRQPLEPRVINLGRFIADMAEMLRRTLGEGVVVETVVAPALWNTLADPAQVESAILNLALNARDAMPGGGRLMIEVANAVLDETYVQRDEELIPGEYVLIAVSDTGHGMDRATLTRVFEPFFTTKGEEKGTGLGLSMVYGFVKQSHGHVQIYSEPGQGTTVKIFLPRSREAEQIEPPSPGGSLRGRSEVVLVVEDDDLVRVSAVGMLRDLGYACIHAADGAEALEALKSDAKIDLLFTDVVMPGPVRSRDLAVEAGRLRPGLPVLFTSGYTQDAIVHHGRLDEGVQLLSKPYTRDSLARRIRSALKLARPVVLVVEDDPLVRMSAVDMVEALGFTVLQAADAPSALKILAEGARVDILFTDIGLPGVRGPELAAQAIALRVGLKVVFASGYGETDETAAIPTAVHLRKPYEQDQLAEVLGAGAD